MTETDETDDELSIEELTEKFEDDEEVLTQAQQERLFEAEPELNPYTVGLNDTKYALSKELRESVERRARNAFSENYRFSCWWKVADASDAQDEDTVHEEGDPILVIETAGPIAPWEDLDQLEVEEQDVSAYDGIDQGDGMDSGSGMRTIDRDSVQGGEDDGEQEIDRTHFGVTPQDFEEMPSPDGERPDRIPAKPVEFDEPTMVCFIPDNPEVDHSWATGEAITSVDTWVEWNVQQRANQPRPDHASDERELKDDSHDHWESLVQMHDSPKVAKLVPTQDDNSDDSRKPDGESSAEKERGSDFEDGKYNGDNWHV